MLKINRGDNCVASIHILYRISWMLEAEATERKTMLKINRGDNCVASIHMLKKIKST
jgi:hypothetical protein